MDTDTLECKIRDKLAEDPRICELIEDDDDFEHLMELIGYTIEESSNPGRWP